MAVSSESQPAMRRFLVVGVDGSPDSLAALRWAMTEAALRGAEVDAVAAFSVPVIADGFGGIFPMNDQFAPSQAAAKETVVNAISRLKGEFPTVETNVVIEFGQAADVVLQAAPGADLIVVGSRGRGGFSTLLLGSTSQQIAHHARCPVVIIPHTK